MKKISEIMTRNVESVGPDTTVKDAARKMKAQDLGSLPVCENGKILGVVTDREMTLGMAVEKPDPTSAPVIDLMNPDAAICFEDDDFEDAARAMEAKSSHHVFVIDKQGKMVGIVSLGKVARAQNEKAAGRVVKRISRSRIKP